MHSESKIRRSMLYIPGNNANMLQFAHAFKADSLIFDLEDSVIEGNKDAARILVRNVIKTIDPTLYGNTEITVRINSLETKYGLDDLENIIPCKPSAVRIPKIESKEQILFTEEHILQIEKSHKIDSGSTKIHPLIESPLGIENAFEIARSSKRIDCLTFGGQDYLVNMGVSNSSTSSALSFAKQKLITAAKAAGIDAQDTVFPDVNDDSGLEAETIYARDLGFSGKSVIHPRQIPIVHKVFRPTTDEIEYAKSIIQHMENSKQKGLGVFSINGKMIDAPVVKRALRVLELERNY